MRAYSPRPAPPVLRVAAIVSRHGKEVFDITENFITVTIPLYHKRNVGNSFSQTATRTIDSSDSKILELMKENANIKELSREKGLKRQGNGS